MGIELFVFDWSGVISDDRKPVYEANNRLLIENGHPGMTFEEWLPQTQLTVIKLLESQGIQCDPEEASMLYKQYLDEAIAKGITPTVYPDVEEVLSYLKNKDKAVAVLSSHPSENLFQEAENYGVRHYLDFVMGGSRDKVQGLKRIVTQKFKLPLEKALYTGDTVYDIRAAKEAGVKCAGIVGPEGNQRGYHSRERLAAESPDFILDSLKDLMDERFI